MLVSWASRTMSLKAGEEGKLSWPDSLVLLAVDSCSQMVAKTAVMMVMTEKKKERRASNPLGQNCFVHQLLLKVEFCFKYNSRVRVDILKMDSSVDIEEHS